MSIEVGAFYAGIELQEFYRIMEIPKNIPKENVLAKSNHGILASGVLEAVLKRADLTDADFLLFDTASVNRGGAGRVFNWDVLRHFEGKPYFLAGGLSPSNVSEAVALLHPYCVDVSSGVETGGAKDAAKITQFVRIVRSMHYQENYEKKGSI